MTDNINERTAVDPEETRAPDAPEDPGATDGGAEEGSTEDRNVNNGDPIPEPVDDEV